MTEKSAWETFNNIKEKEIEINKDDIFNINRKKEPEIVISNSEESESAWNSFVKENSSIYTPPNRKENELTLSYYRTLNRSQLDPDVELNIENLSVNSITSFEELRKNSISSIADYSFITDTNKEMSAWKSKEHSRSSSIASLDLLSNDKSNPNAFLASDISAWRSTSSKDDLDINEKKTFMFENDQNNADSISAWKVDSSKTIQDILKGFDIKQAIGKGFCGTIFKGINAKTGKPIAVKAEKIKEKNKHLQEEYAIYQRLFGLEGMPQVLYYGQLEKENIMIMELLGPSLEALFTLCDRRFSMKTICMIAKQLITRLEKVHERGIVYRDIKPENFLIGYIDYSKPILNKYPPGEEVYLQDGTLGRPPVSTIYLADFGLSEFYKDQITNDYVPYKKKPPCGTPRYMSLNTHRCDQQSPRDDLEALCYCLMYLCFRGKLPWMGITAKTPEVMIMSIGKTKASISVEQLCKTLPRQFASYLNYVRKLEFHDKPDYNYLRNLFDEILKENGKEDDGDFDWIAQIRIHQEHEAKRQKAEREKELKRVEAERKKRAKIDKKRKLVSMSESNLDKTRITTQSSNVILEVRGDDEELISNSEIDKKRNFKSMSYLDKPESQSGNNLDATNSKNNFWSQIFSWKKKSNNNH